jgi:hypothetical protein
MGHHRLSVYLRETIYQGIWNHAKQNRQLFARENHRNNQDLPWCPNIFRTFQIKLCDFHNRMALPHTMPIDLPDLTSIFQRWLPRTPILSAVHPPRTLPCPTAVLPYPSSQPPRCRPTNHHPPMRPVDRYRTMWHRPLPTDQTSSPMLPSTPRTRNNSTIAENPPRRSATARAPLKLHGGRICLSSHLKGTCFLSNCGTGTCTGQTLDGHRPLVGDEVNRFATFVAAAVTRA